MHKFLIFFLFLCQISYGADIQKVTGFKDKDLHIVNENWRKLDEQVADLEATVASAETSEIVSITANANGIYNVSHSLGVVPSYWVLYDVDNQIYINRQGAFTDTQASFNIRFAFVVTTVNVKIKLIA